MVDLSRRKFLLQYCQGASLAFLPAGLGLPSAFPILSQQALPQPTELYIHPHYRTQRDLDAVLKMVQAGQDEFVTEKYQDQIAAIFTKWSAQLQHSPQEVEAIEKSMQPNFAGASPKPAGSKQLRPDSGLKVYQLSFLNEALLDRDAFLEQWRSSVNVFSKILTAEFQLTSIRPGSPSVRVAGLPASLETRVRFELVGTGNGFYREQRVGNWELLWETVPPGEFRLSQWRMLEETRSRSHGPVFVDIAAQAFSRNPSYAAQLLHGTDYWRTVLDGACGIDIYGHNGASVADIDGDGFDDLYVCQPAGLPNRLYRNRGDGSFEDITESSGLGILENTACALFADIDNDGRQDLIVVNASGPQLFMNEGGGKFRQRPDAFRFASPPQGTFVGAAIADYDRDGWLDIYFALYVYYQGTGQYRYPSPYFDAENGPPNFLMRNNRDGSFRDVTRETGLTKNNTRFSFCCGWGDYNGDQWPDLYVVNDFGRKNLYRNNGDGTFTDVASQAGVEDVGAGMSVCWLDYDRDGREDLYVADMWTAAGIRVSTQDNFQKDSGEKARAYYRKHSMGNSLLQNQGSNTFEDRSMRSGSSIGRWAWSSDAWDFDHDGFPDLYVANGMISGARREDLNSFFWRQVVAYSPDHSKPDIRYEQGWMAINELIRSDGTWSGFERNVFFLNNHDGTFSDVSGVVGLDFIEDSRSFAVGDFDRDGRLEVVLKNRSGPQVRLLKNVMADLKPAISFRLTGRKSNRDAIGAAVTVETESGRQTRLLQAGSGFVAQHSKDLFFGLGDAKSSVNASIRWPSGLVQNFRDLPSNHRIWVEEGSPPTRVEPFKSSSPWTAPTPGSFVPATETLPVSSETWLLAPVVAPEIGLADLAGQRQTLSSRRGKPVLLYFWSPALPDCENDLANFEKSHASWTNQGFQLLTMCVDDSPDAAEAQVLALYRHLSVPILQASREVVAVYNLLYRSLFDRHRDLGLPTSFLIDERGSIAKIYRGSFPAERFEQDFRAIPRTAADRMAKALPFPGVIESTDFGRNYLAYGSVFFERGYPEQAEAFFQSALKDDPTSAEAFYGIGSVYLELQKPVEARRCFEKAVHVQASFPGTMQRAWNNLGILDAREGRDAEAVRNFQRALQIDPDYVIALENLGNAYRQQKLWKDAQNAFQRALQLSPMDPEANYGTAMVYAQLNDTDHAYEYLQKALAARPAYPEALNNLGILYLRTQRLEEAEKSFKESIRVAPDFDQAYLNLARFYAIKGEPQKARAVLLALLKQHPGHPQAQRELGQLAE